MHAILRFHIALLGVVLVSACGETVRVSPETTSPPVPVAAEPARPADEVEALLAEAAAARPGQAIDLRLDAAAKLLERGDTARAVSLLDSIGRNSLASARWVRFSVLRARADLAAGRAREAAARLQNPALEAESGALPPALQVDFRLARAAAQEAQGRTLEAARDRAYTQAWISDTARREENARAIVAALQKVATGELERAAAEAGSDDWRGWIEFAAITRDLRGGSVAQRERLRAWSERYGALPVLDAAVVTLLPETLSRIRQPRRVALMLPLGGRAAGAARAVLDGYLAEHLAQIARGETPPLVAVVDTAAADFATAYAAAVADGADFVIGPLLKEELQELAALDVRVPTLALNFSDTPLPGRPQLYQFGLDWRDEIAQLQRQAFAAGARRVVVLQDGSERAARSTSLLREQWPQHGGTVLATHTLADLNEYRRTLENSLLIASSQERAQTLTRLLGLKIESEPRRRQDVDLVLLFAEPEAARSIRPLLPFIYAGDLPVLGSSQIHAGPPDAENDRDLEGVAVLDLPWFGDFDATLRASLGEQRAAGDIARLGALGADACRLQSRLAMLQAGDALAGATGLLRLGTGGRIHREADRYVFTDGRIVPAPAGTQPEHSREGDTSWTENTRTTANP